MMQLSDARLCCKALMQGCGAGMDVIFHCATAQLIGANASNEKLMLSVNVTGTTNIIDACIKHKVPRLVYTSTASVVFEGKPLVDVDETQPYASKPMDFYTSTKVGSSLSVPSYVPYTYLTAAAQNIWLLWFPTVSTLLCMAINC